MVVGGLEQTGALESAANIISMVSGRKYRPDYIYNHMVIRDSQRIRG